VACGAPVDAPLNRLSAGARAGRGVLADEDPARREDPLMSGSEVANQNVRSGPDLPEGLQASCTPMPPAGTDCCATVEIISSCRFAAIMIFVRPAAS
jgi:hypothetical protein